LKRAEVPGVGKQGISLYQKTFARSAFHGVILILTVLNTIKGYSCQPQKRSNKPNVGKVKK
jgi:hypothetical protein